MLCALVCLSLHFERVIFWGMAFKRFITYCRYSDTQLWSEVNPNL